MPLDGTELSPERRVLLGAADLIESHGHTKRALIDPDNAMCAEAALIFQAAGIAPSYGRLDEAMNRAWGPGDPHPFRRARDLLLVEIARRGLGARDIAQWNNHPNRTAAEVIDAMRAAAFQDDAT